MSDRTPSPSAPNWVRALGAIFSVVALVLLVFISQSLVALRDEIGHLSETLVTRDQLANLAARLGPTDPAMAGLEGTCTDCHDVKAFRDSHKLDDVEVHELVTRMSQLAGAHIAPEEVPRAEAALTFMKCAHCHSIDRLKELAILSPEERWKVIVSMMEAPGAKISQEDAQRIRDFYGDFWGWHRKN